METSQLQLHSPLPPPMSGTWTPGERGRAWAVHATAIWPAGVIWGTIALPDRPYSVRPMLYIGCGYFAALSLAKIMHDHRVRRSAPAVIEA